MGARREGLWRQGGMSDKGPALSGGAFPRSIAQPLLQHPEVIGAKERLAVCDDEWRAEHALRNSVFDLRLQFQRVLSTLFCFQPNAHLFNFNPALFWSCCQD